MSFAIENIRDIYTDHLNEIYKRCPEKLMANISEAIMPSSDAIADAFYTSMRTINSADTFLVDEIIDERLKTAMTEWIRELFKHRNEEEVTQYVERQLQIGSVHARVNIPPHLLNTGIRVVKLEIQKHLLNTDMPTSEYRDKSTLMSMVIDVSASLMNESYLGDLLQGERKAQSLQMHVSGQELAFRCEKFRADIFSWHGQMLNLILKEKMLNREKIPKLTHSDLGLWINHKARLFCPDINEIDQISEQIEEVDRFLDQLIELSSSTKATSLTPVLGQFDESLQTLARKLGSLAQQCLAMDSGKDTLTRLMNRRYLDTVLQKETLFSIKNNRPYVIIMIDIDHFKRINDEYGHDAGDKVLGQVAEILDSTIRAVDYIFRYGGEEFLILLPDIKDIHARNVAEKLRTEIESHSFDIGRQQINVTISLGLAEHDGQPDFSRIVSQADKALYQAKDAGRNRYQIANKTGR